MKKELNSSRPLISSILYISILWLTVEILVNWPWFTDYVYPSFFKRIYPFTVKFYGWIPFSAGDLFYFLLILLLGWSIISGVQCFLLGQKWRGFRIMARMVNAAGILYLVFHLFWGFNYYKPNLIEAKQMKNIRPEELKFIADDILNETLSLREHVREDKKGIFDFNRMEFYPSLNAEIKFPRELYAPYLQIPRKAEIKYSIFSFFMRHSGVTGYFNPFTHEAQITRLMPDTGIPFTMAHEMAHQMGYARESEANFAGYLSCIQSGDTALQYSAQFKALKYVLNEIYPNDTVYVKKKLELYSEGMQRDLEAERQYSRRYAGITDRTFSAMNDAYLKANNQEEGLESYNHFVDLLVIYYRNERQLFMSDKDSEQ